ncbi:hypothetical protein Tco_0947186 [Tanacetum coccineum]
MVRPRRQGIICRRRKCGETEPKMMNKRDSGAIRISGEKSFRLKANQSEEHIPNPSREKIIRLDMKSMQDQVRAGVISYKTDQDILDEVVPSTNRQNMSGKGRKLPGGGSTSRRRGPQAFPDAISREELDRILRQKDQEAELLRKQTAEAQQRAYLAALKADATYQNSKTMYGAIGNNDVREDNQQSGGDYSEDEEGDNEEVHDKSEESD